MWFLDQLTLTFNAARDAAGQFFAKWFTTEEQAILAFFAPLINQVRDQALILGKNNLDAGFKILQDSAMAAVTASLTAPPGTQVVAAEAAFLQVMTTEGITAVNNAQAATIRAAVAIVQSNPTLVSIATQVATPK